MKKGNDIIGKSIITRETGEKIAQVHDLVFDHSTNQLLAFLVDEAGWFKDAKVVPFEHVVTMGPDAVIVASRSAVISARENALVNRILENHNVMKGTKILTEGGQELGKLMDIYFDEHNGKIVGYEASGGLFADAYSGRSFIPAAYTLKIGQDVAFVPNETTQLMEEHTGGIKEAAQQAQQTAKKAYDETKEAMGSKISETTASMSLEQAKGRRVQQTVYANNGMIIAAVGQIVTDDVIEQTKHYHQQQALLDAVNLSTTEAVKTQAEVAGEKIKSQVQSTSETVREQAKNFWDKTKKQVNVLKDKAADELEQQRVMRAVGRPVTRVILDKNDAVILNTGDIVTNDAVEKARQAGTLEILLRSVDTSTAHVSKEERRM